jgi:hypothetical protein
VPRKPSANLSVVGDDQASTLPRPPLTLKASGLALWNSVVSVYQFDDAGSFHVLAMACQSLDRGEACREAIDKDGECIWTKAGPKAHPLIRDETQSRALCHRLIKSLGLDLEPIRGSVGRPPGYSPQLGKSL